MSLEPGGRADKYGNKYENQYLAKLLLRLAREKLVSIIVEPLGPNSDSVEYIAEEDGKINYYQCKGSNSTKKFWSVADLKGHDVWNRARKIVSDVGKYYHFISPLPYNEIDELCKRARTNLSPQQFVECQLNNDTICKQFKECANALHLDPDCPGDLGQLVYILSHCYFEHSPTGLEAQRDLEERISQEFTGNESNARILLEQYANDTGRYGVKITAKDVIDYMEKNGFHPRHYGYDTRVLERINVLNHTHWDEFSAIYDKLVHRNATEQVINDLHAGKSVILHGRAGFGKSGCLQEIINFLNEKGTLYLAVKLDKHTPAVSADDYGRELGLPESPVYSLSAMAAGEKCVLILDQLDSLRWTNSHSSTALDVCKELIKQAESINGYQNGNVSIIFAARTFDLENDKGLKSLFENPNQERQRGLVWSRVKVDSFTEEEVTEIIGARYKQLPSRLQKLLLTPSSLYVWTQLEENSSKNHVSSVYGLMENWWAQIQNQCTCAGIRAETINNCRDKIVEYMENRGRFVIPRGLLNDYHEVIDRFISSGLLKYNQSTNGISFVHQSFLDYFIVADFNRRIYSGADLCALVGGLDEQTPMIRYRVLSVLQSLIDTDQSMFAEQGKKMLESDGVRYYFKCTVFEIMGQCEQPEAEVLALLDDYIQQSEWRSYVIQAVLSRHPQYIRHVLKERKGALDDESAGLLESISDIDPDYVTEYVAAFALQDEEKDRLIFGTLCADPSEDSESMFQLRCDILRKHPTILNEFWGVSRLLECRSIRIIDVFEIILDNWEQCKGAHIHIYVKDLEQWGLNSKVEYQVFLKRLFEKICDVTKKYTPQWPYTLCGVHWEFREWIQSGYNDSTVREIVNISKRAIEEYAKIDPAWVMEFVRVVEYPISAVGHELIMHAICFLPDVYANEAIGWICQDFDEKMLVYSAREGDYLYYTKQILRKFTMHCDETFYRQLEHIIYKWKENIDQMTDILRDRIKWNRDCKNQKVYWMYWGHLQKDLLPCMDFNRLSEKSKALIQELNRNTWVCIPHFHCGVLSGPVRSVVSPVHDHADRLSDRRWLQIISTPADKMKEHLFKKVEGDHCIEASHGMFASSMRKQAEQEPERFAKLALSFPQNCDAAYICSILNALSDEQKNENITTELIEAIIQRFSHRSERNIAMSVSQLISSNVNRVWGREVLELICNMAVAHPEPKENDYIVTSQSDPDHLTANALLQNSINCVRGEAVGAVAALLWNHNDLGEYFKSTVIQASKDKNAAVRFALMDCVEAYYQIDRKFAYDVFRKILDQDLRVLYASGSWTVIREEYMEHSMFLRNKLIEACATKLEDLEECAAGMLCAVGVFFSDSKALEWITSAELSTKAKSRICRQAISSFDLDEFHEVSEEILLYYLENTSESIDGLGQLFIRKKISIHRDKDFLSRLFSSGQSPHLVHLFLKYLYESGEDICEYTPVLMTIVEGFEQGKGVRRHSYLEVTDLIKCVVKLFDRGEKQPSIRAACLDIWDKLFRSNIQAIKPLSDLIDDFG